MKTYTDAIHAMQSGVAAKMNFSPNETEPKHLRVGVNVAMRDLCSLALLLVEKGVITLEEYRAALQKGMNEEVALYEQELSAHFGKTVTLG